MALRQTLSLVPTWVEAEPGRERATDALGLQLVADHLAERLLPGISVLTTRARYLSFLCWAREKVGAKCDEGKIHWLEAALARSEAIQGPEHSKDCPFVGSRRAGRFLDDSPRSPREIYRVPVWRTYRPSLIDLGLVQEGDGWDLTELGEKLARAYRTAVRPREQDNGKPLPKRACLSNVSTGEKTILRPEIGLSRRGRMPDCSQNESHGLTRARLAKSLKDRFGSADRTNSGVVLESALRKISHEEPWTTLRQAAVWEYLSLGLNSVFLAWAVAVREGPGAEKTFRNRLSKAARQPGEPQDLCSVSPTKNDPCLAPAMNAIRRALSYEHERLDQLDATQFENAEEILKRPEAGLNGLLKRHLGAKDEGERWILESGASASGVQRGDAKSLPKRVIPRTYRIDAFLSLARDLGDL